MQRIKIPGLVLIILVSFISFNSSHFIDCSKVKNGKFYYFAKLDGRKVFIERIDSLQIETDAKTNKVLRSKIIWQNECKFQLFVNALSGFKLSKEDSIKASKPTLIEITGVYSDFYTCIVKFSTLKRDYELKDTMYFQK